MPKISIIIPVYNVEKYIKECLCSCISQDKAVLGSDYEIIIVNDGSPDKSATIAQDITRNIDGCRIINQENKGLGAARNTGIENSIGEYIWFVDSDDWINRKSVRTLIEVIDNHAPDIINFRAANVVDNCYFVRENEIKNAPVSISGRRAFISHKWETCAPFNCYKKDFLNNYTLRFMEGVLHEDNEFTPRVLWFASRIIRINDILYYVRQTPHSITRTPNPRRSLDLIMVCDSLHQFNKNKVTDLHFRKCMNSFISLSINNALNIISKQSDQTIRQQFNDNLFNHKYLFKNLIHSTKFKYIIEGILFHVHTNYIHIYAMLSSFKK